MKKKFKGLILLIFPLMIISYKKECHYAGLPSKKSDNNNGLVENTVYIHSNIAGTPDNQIIQIDDDTSYYHQFRGFYLDPYPPLGKIDFKTKTLLGVHITTSMADGVTSQGYLNKKLWQNIFTYTVQYSLKDQCAGSGIMSINFTGWLIGPKLPPQSIVQLKTEDVNPF
jgi:hypothetical protein